MANVVSASLMFDEASDIQMAKHLNMFVNVLLETGEVKTLTLALAGSLRLLVIYHLNFQIRVMNYGIILNLLLLLLFVSVHIFASFSLLVEISYFFITL
jgi:hypothetical protein